MESDQNLEINKIHIARPIFAWEPGLLKMIFEPHKNMPSCKKSANYLKYWANSSLFIFFLEVSEIQWGARFPIHLTTPIPTPYLSYLPHTIPTPHTYPIPTHTYKKQPIPTLYQTYFKVRIRLGARHYDFRCFSKIFLTASNFNSQALDTVLSKPDLHNIR